MANITRNKYQLPIPLDKLISIDTDSSPAHSGKLENAIDFVAPENTIVLAAAEGTVTYVKDYSYIGGPLSSVYLIDNFIYGFTYNVPMTGWVIFRVPSIVG